MQNQGWGQLKSTVVPAEMNHYSLEHHSTDMFGRTKFVEPITHVVTDEWKITEINQNHKEQKHINTTQTFFNTENRLF